ncbi:peptidoglycan recognition family protein [Tardiphaga sp.]|uniref:peptidoglycan recognition protein family protein n=1 Tax=Tardiphaga sp. TaxID=1926292 RepID=UPI0026209277|nr:peptidoglycan recognition family protein [Tardiphaga sp.]
MKGLISCMVLALLWLAGPVAAQTAAPSPDSFETLARSRGTPDIPGLNIVWLIPWGPLENARDWRNIVVHQSEGSAGSAWRSAVAQSQRPSRRGVTIWVETDGTVYWAAAEFAVPNHLRDGNRNDNKFIDNSSTFQQVDNDSSIGVEFVGNYPNVRRPVTEAQVAAWRILVRVLQIRYDIPSERVFAHNWVDYKDSRYCEGCDLAKLARTQGVETAQRIDRDR